MVSLVWTGTLMRFHQLSLPLQPLPLTAYMSETIRATIQAVDAGEIEVCPFSWDDISTGLPSCHYSKSRLLLRHQV